MSFVGFIIGWLANDYNSFCWLAFWVVPEIQVFRFNIPEFPREFLKADSLFQGVLSILSASG